MAELDTLIIVQTVAIVTMAIATISYVVVTYLTLIKMNRNAMTNLRPLISFAGDDHSSYSSDIREIKPGEYVLDNLVLDIINRGMGPAINVDCETKWKFGFLMTIGLCTVMKEGESAHVRIDNVEQAQPLRDDDSLIVILNYESTYSEKFQFFLKFRLISEVPSFILFEVRNEVVKKK